MHLHVNPFQIVELPKNITAGTSYTSWFEASMGGGGCSAQAVACPWAWAQPLLISPTLLSVAACDFTIPNLTVAAGG